MIRRFNTVLGRTHNNNISDVKIISYIGNFISFFSGILSILSFYGYSKNDNLSLVILGTILLVVTICVFSVRHIISKVILVFIMNKTVPKPNIEILDKTVTYVCKQDDKYDFNSVFSINVVGDSPICTYEDRIKWSAGVINHIEPIIPGQTIAFSDKPESHSRIDKQEFIIKFDNYRCISKTDIPYKTGFAIKNLEDENHVAKPMLGVGIYHVTRNLTLRVEFDKRMHPTIIRGLKYAHFIDKSPYDTDTLELLTDDSRGIKYVEFSIKNPIYGGLYAIDWKLED